MLERKKSVVFTIYEVHWPELVKDLPRTLDRFRAASFFFDVKLPPFLKASIDARKWISWASITALISISEVVEMDFDDLGLLSAWKNSEQYQEIQKNEILIILKEIRNYEIHFEFNNRITHTEIKRSKVKENIDHNSFFFAPIDWDILSKLRNIRLGRSLITESMVNNFNLNIAQRYSVETIIKSMLDWYAELLYSFLQNAIRNDQL